MWHNKNKKNPDTFSICCTKTITAPLEVMVWQWWWPKQTGAGSQPSRPQTAPPTLDWSQRLQEVLLKFLLHSFSYSEDYHFLMRYQFSLLSCQLLTDKTLFSHIFGTMMALKSDCISTSLVLASLVEYLLVLLIPKLKLASATANQWVMCPPLECTGSWRTNGKPLSLET